MSPKKNPEYVWIVAYINRDYIKTVEQDLLNCGFGAIKVFIPTVRILKKQFKNKNIYDYVPLLFNYGFFQIPYRKACDAEFLIKLRQEIPAVYSWVKDPMVVIREKPNLRIDNRGRNPNVAIVKESEIVELLKISEHLSIFSDEVVDKLETGSFIILKGYPYDNMPAEIITINKVKKQVKVKLLLETMIAEVMVHFENIFYTVYSNYGDGSVKEKSLEEIGEKGKHYLDKLYANINYGEREN